MKTSTLIIIAIAAVVGVLVFLAMRKKKKPDVPKNDGLQGVSLGTLKPYNRPDGGVIWLDIDHPFDLTTQDGNAKRDLVVQTIANAIADERQTSAYREPSWAIPPVAEYHVYIIKPMAFTEDGLPALILQPKDASGRPMGPPIKTAGTVFNVSQFNTPRVGGATNPFIVIAWQENWDRMDYLYASVVNEAEHLTERWQSFETFLQWTGPNDVHRHRQPRMEAVGLGLKAAAAMAVGFPCGLTQPEKEVSAKRWRHL
jgi:hypothetical protein